MGCPRPPHYRALMLLLIFAYSASHTHSGDRIRKIVMEFKVCDIGSGIRDVHGVRLYKVLSCHATHL